MCLTLSNRAALALQLNVICCFFIIHFIAPVAGQSPTPSCSFLRVSQASGQPGDTVWLDIRANLPDGVSTFQFALTWNADQLSFARLDISQTELPYLATGDFYPAKPGQLLFIWYDLAGVGISLPPDALLFRAGYVFEAGAGDFSPVFIGGAPPFSFEMTNKMQHALPENCTHGGVFKFPTAGNTPVITQICTTPAGCLIAGDFGQIDLTVSGGVPPYQFDWKKDTLPTGNTEDLNGLEAGKYNVTITDQNGRSATARAQIRSVQPNINILAIEKDDPCQISAGSISLTTTGSYPPFNYRWLHNGATTSSLNGLKSGNYSVVVTDAAGCSVQRFYQIAQFTKMLVTESITRPSCQAPTPDGQITLAVQYGKAPHTFLWNVPGANSPALINIPSGTYSVTVADGNGCKISRTYDLSDLEADNWSLLHQTYCDPGQGPGHILLYINGDSTLKWPLSSTWSNGASHILNGSSSLSTIDSVNALNDGVYSVVIQDARGCRKSISGMTSDCAAQLVYAEKTCFALHIGSINAQPGEIICIPVSVTNFTDIQRFETSMQWDTSRLEFYEVQNGSAALSSYFKAAASPIGFLRLTWIANTYEGVSLPDEAVLFYLCLRVKSTASNGVSSIRFGPDYYGPGTFQIKTGKHFLGVIGFEGAVGINAALPEPLNLTACATFPSCATDVHSDIQITVLNGTPPYAVQWSSAGIVKTGTLDDLYYLPAGLTLITVTDQTGRNTVLAASSFTGYGNFTCVWPGDCDDNNAVNQYDLLYLGYAYGSSGIPRLEQGVNWQGYWQGLSPGFTWGITTPVRHIDFSNMDCSGNGAVDDVDLDILLQHWGNVVRPGFDDPLALPFLPPDANGQVFQVSVQPDTLLMTDEVFVLPVQVGTPNAPAVGINGLAFSIFYDTAAIRPDGLLFVPAVGWIGNPDSSTWSVQKNFPEAGRFDLAISRKGNSPQTGFGPIGTLQGFFQGDMLRDYKWDTENTSFTDTAVVTHFKIDRLLAMGSGETALAALGLETPLVIVPEITNHTGSPQAQSPRVRISPNPANSTAAIQCGQETIEAITLFSINGAALIRLFDLKSPVKQLDCSQLPAGLYWVGVQTLEGKEWVKLAVQH